MGKVLHQLHPCCLGRSLPKQATTTVEQVKAMKKLNVPSKKKGLFSGYHPQSFQSGCGGGAKSGCARYQPYHKGGNQTGQSSSRTTKTKGLRISVKLCKLSKRDHKLSPYFEFKCNSALNKEGNSSKFACWPNEAVQRELGLAYSGSLGTANSSGVSATTYKPASSGISSSPGADVTRAAGPGINRDTDNGRETGHISDPAGSEGLCLPGIFGFQKGWRPPSHSELKRP